MPAKHNAGGCKCCEPVLEPDPLCENCQNGTYPSYLDIASMDFSGDGVWCNDTQCNYHDGTWHVAPSGTDCIYTQSKAFNRLVACYADIDCVMAFQLISGTFYLTCTFSSYPTVYATYSVSLGTGLVDCSAGWTLSKTYDIGICTWPATITVTAVP